MRLLLTRSQRASATLAWRLESAGHNCLLAPLLEIAPTGLDPAPPADTQAFLFTSTNAASIFADACPRRDLPAFAVGEATAAVLRSYGFETVRSAQGDADALIRLAHRSLSPGNGSLLYIRARDVRRDLANALQGLGYTVEERILYASNPVSVFPSQAAEALGGGKIDAVLIFSARTAKAFAGTLPPEARKGLGGTRGIVISRSAATAVQDLGFLRIEVAPKPNADSLLSLLEVEN